MASLFSNSTKLQHESYVELSGYTLLFIVYVYFTSPGQNGRHFADDIFRSIFVNATFCTSIRISQKFVPKGLIDNKFALA